MTTTLLVLALIAADADSKPRKPSGIAPSLRAVTKEEEAKFDEIVARLILADTGRLRGTAARKAVEEFEKLEPEAIPSMIRGLNKAARQNHTCPVLMIRKKLEKMLMASKDPELLQFARDEIGADTRGSRHAGTLADLRVRIMIRKNALDRLGTTRPARPKGAAGLTTSELAKAASTQRGEKLKGVIQELGKRTGKEAMGGLAVAASSYDTDVQKLARENLDLVLGRLSPTALARQLEDDSAEVRRSAIRVAAAKHTKLVPRVIDRVIDESEDVRDEARAALKKLSKGEDFGPSFGADKEEQRRARQKWLDWWARQK